MILLLSRKCPARANRQDGPRRMSAARRIGKCTIELNPKLTRRFQFRQPNLPARVTKRQSDGVAMQFSGLTDTPLTPPDPSTLVSRPLSRSTQFLLRKFQNFFPLPTAPCGTPATIGRTDARGQKSEARKCRLHPTSP